MKSESATQVSTAPLGPRKVTGKTVERPKRSAGVQSYIPEIAKGLALLRVAVARE